MRLECSLCLFALFHSIAFAGIQQLDELPKSILPPPPKGKHLRDYTDRDLEALFEQWEANDEPLESDEIDGWKKPPPLNINLLKAKNTEQASKILKKGRRDSLFVKFDEKLRPAQVDDVIRIWMIRFFNNHIHCQRRMVNDHEVDLLFHDGSQVWDAKHFIMEQDEVYEAKYEQVVYDGKAKLKATEKKEL